MNPKATGIGDLECHGWSRSFHDGMSSGFVIIIIIVVVVVVVVVMASGQSKSFDAK